MTTFTAAEIAEITGVKECVIHYWEEYVPSIKPKHDEAGRKLYSQNDMKKFLRIRHLVFVEKYTIEGAARKIQQEIDGRTTNMTVHSKIDEEQLKKDLSYMNEELLKVYSLVKQHAENRK